MHVLIVFLVLVVMAVGGYLQSTLLVALRVSRSHPPLYLISLATPMLALALMFFSFCWEMIPGWDGHVWHDHALLHALAWSAAIIAAGAVTISLSRAVLVMTIIRRYPKMTDPGLIAPTQRLASQLGIASPTLRVCHSAHPLAALCGVPGLGRKTILLSSWVISNLDEEEKEAVLAHELVHLKRHDDIVLWVAQLARDIVFYIPGLWRICRQLQIHIQMACDKLASELTGQRLALASAICKVEWQALHARAKVGWALNTSPMIGFYNARAVADRVALLLGERQEIAEAKPWGRNLAQGWWVGTVASFQVVTVSSLYFFCCRGHPAHLALLSLFVSSGILLTLMLLSVRKA